MLLYTYIACLVRCSFFFGGGGVSVNISYDVLEQLGHVEIHTFLIHCAVYEPKLKECTLIVVL